MHSLLAPSSPFSCSLSCYCRPHVSYRLHFAFLRTIQSYIWRKNGRHSMILGFAAYFKITERLPCIPGRSHGMIFRSFGELLVPLKYLTACVFVYVYAVSVWVCIYACMCAVFNIYLGPRFPQPSASPKGESAASVWWGFAVFSQTRGRRGGGNGWRQKNQVEIRMNMP